MINMTSLEADATLMDIAPTVAEDVMTTLLKADATIGEPRSDAAKARLAVWLGVADGFDVHADTYPSFHVVGPKFREAIFIGALRYASRLPGLPLPERDSSVYENYGGSL